jgi:hypothetical protein
MLANLFHAVWLHFFPFVENSSAKGQPHHKYFIWKQHCVAILIINLKFHAKWSKFETFLTRVHTRRTATSDLRCSPSAKFVQNWTKK